MIDLGVRMVYLMQDKKELYDENISKSTDTDYHSGLWRPPSGLLTEKNQQFILWFNQTEFACCPATVLSFN